MASFNSTTCEDNNNFYFDENKKLENGKEENSYVCSYHKFNRGHQQLVCVCDLCGLLSM